MKIETSSSNSSKKAMTLACEIETKKGSYKGHNKQAEHDILIITLI